MQRLAIIKATVAVLLAFAGLSSQPITGITAVYAQSKPTWFVSYSGTDLAKDSFYSYTGALIALNRDLSRSGLVVQGFGAYGSYEYANPSISGGVVDGDMLQFSALVGYLYVRNGGSAGLYIGVDYHDHDLKPDDASNDVRDDEAGLKVAGDIRHISGRQYLTAEGSYSTAFNSYWARARAGLNYDRFAFGPEALVLGNDGFKAQRIGGFVVVRYDLNRRTPVEVTMSGGYQFVDDDQGTASSGGGEGPYGAVNFSVAF